VLVFKKTPDETEKNKATGKPYRTKKNRKSRREGSISFPKPEKIEPPILYWAGPCKNTSANQLHITG
jgi:hypothetical protein